VKINHRGKHGLIQRFGGSVRGLSRKLGDPARRSAASRGRLRTSAKITHKLKRRSSRGVSGKVSLFGQPPLSPYHVEMAQFPRRPSAEPFVDARKPSTGGAVLGPGTQTDRNDKPLNSEVLFLMGDSHPYPQPTPAPPTCRLCASRAYRASSPYFQAELAAAASLAWNLLARRSGRLGGRLLSEHARRARL
jgi:hypothetical protein